MYMVVLFLERSQKFSWWLLRIAKKVELAELFVILDDCFH